MSDFHEIKRSIDSYCGLQCSACEFRERMGCGGCIATQGHPFHGECQLAQCAVKKGRGFCGECADFPCGLLESYSNDPEHGDDPHGARIQACAATKARLVAAARAGGDPQGMCGHHCDHCPYTNYCGGCRSVYNNCSFATLYEDGRCPNLVCAKEQGLDGCYACQQLEKCSKGYFGAQDGFTAKASAQFIAVHGKEAYASVLSGLGDRPESIDTVEKLLSFYESGLDQSE